MGRVLASITADSCGLHDCIAGGSTPESNARKYGDDAIHRNTRDNFLLAAAKHGLGPRDVGALHHVLCAGVATDETGRSGLAERCARPASLMSICARK